MKTGPTSITLLIACIILLCQKAMSIQVSGDVWGVWSPDDNPYQVVGELRVPSESTLVIQPGCYIDFQGHYKLIVDTSATLQAVGTELDSIVFTTEDTLTGWHGIRFLNAGSSCELSFCIVEWGKADTSEDEIGMPNTMGGGVYCDASNLTISHCLIRKNKANIGKGGGIFCRNSNVLISDNYICYNWSAFGGAGIWCDSSDVEIIKNTIKENGAYYPLGGEVGGGISCLYSSILISDNIIYHNWSYFVCGGILICGCTGSVEFNTINSNQALDSYGGMVVVISSVIISYNLIINNMCLVYAGGGISIGESDFTALNNIIVGNSAPARGGGIHSTQAIDDTLVNNIIWGNEAYNGPQIYDSEGTLTVIYNDIQGGWEGEGNINIDPLFRDPDNGDFHLMAIECGDPYDSPCIDAGHPNILDSLLDCSWGLGELRSDMGAYGGGLVNVGIDDQVIKLPSRFILSQNYPNPFNSSTNISFSLSEPSNVEIDIYDMLGRKITTFPNSYMSEGNHAILWKPGDLSSGVYFYKITAGDFSSSQKMILLK